MIMATTPNISITSLNSIGCKNTNTTIKIRNDTQAYETRDKLHGFLVEDKTLKTENVIGFIFYQSIIDNHTIQITDFNIIENYRNKSIGTQLLNTLIHSFQHETHFNAFIECNNHIALNCYQKCKFKIDKKVSNYYGKNKHALKLILNSNSNNVHSYNSNQVAQYSVRFAINKDITQIKALVNETWPTNSYHNSQITFVVEKRLLNEENKNNNKQIVGFAQCLWKRLYINQSRHAFWYKSDFEFEIRGNKMKSKNAFVFSKEKYKELFEYNMCIKDDKIWN
eukprot:516757_1